MVYDVAIIGCGIIGASTAYQLSKHNVKTLVLEMHNDVSMGTTKANSAILHAGYDPEPGTDMAYLNVHGSAMAKEICTALNVSYKQIGSFVLGFNKQDEQHIKKLYDNGIANNVPDIQIISGEKVRMMDKNISEDVTCALYAPSAAIVDPWEYALAMAQVAVKNGTQLELKTKVSEIKEQDDIYLIKTTKGEFKAKYIVNAAGVNADEVNNLAVPQSFTIKANKGEYFLLDKTEGQRVKHVVFQCPTKEGKGVLVAPTVHGNLIVGPNAQDADKNDVSTSFEGLNHVSKAAVKSVPSVDFRANIRSFAGLRALSDKDDFIIEFATPRFLNLAGIKSPGLSAAAAIGERAVNMLSENGLLLTEKQNFDNTRPKTKFTHLSEQEKRELIKKSPEYGRVICRCVTITEGEIIESIKAPIPPCSLNGVKRRAGAGMGRCQGGFCGPRVVEILARELKLDPMDILNEQEGTYILTGRTKTKNGGASK